MRKKLLSVVVMLMVATFALAGCGSNSGTTGSSENNNPVQQVTDTVKDVAAQILDGQVTGEVGKTYRTQWFDFTVISIDKVDSYAGHSAPEGYQLYDVLITETGTFSTPSPMGTFDFYMDDPSFPDYIFPIDALDDNMMPDEFPLAKNETVEYHMIYEIPTNVTNLVLMYTEIDETDAEGTTFSIPIK